MFYLLFLIFHCCNVRTWLSTFLSFVFLKGFFLSFLIFNGLWMSLFQVYATRIFWELQRKRKILGKWCQIVVPVYLFYLLVVDHHFGFKYLCSYWKINYQVELCCIWLFVVAVFDKHSWKFVLEEFKGLLWNSVEIQLSHKIKISVVRSYIYEPHKDSRWSVTVATVEFRGIRWNLSY